MEWETVGKKNKKKQPDIIKNDILSPSVFNGLDVKKTNKSEKVKSVKPTNKIHSRNETPNTVTPKLLKDALQNFDCDALRELYNNSYDLFPNNPIVWLKDISFFISKKLEVSQITSLMYADYHDFPCKSDLQSMFSTCDDSGLLAYIEFFTSHCAKDSKENTMHGHKLMIQQLMDFKPSLIVDHMDVIKENLDQNINKPQKCLPIFWMIMQISPQSHFYEALFVWAYLLVPYVTNFNYTKYINGYGELLCKASKKQSILTRENAEITKCIESYIFPYNAMNEKNKHQTTNQAVEDKNERSALSNCYDIYNKLKNVENLTKDDLTSLLPTLLKRFGKSSVKDYGYSDSKNPVRISLADDICHTILDCYNIHPSVTGNILKNIIPKCPKETCRFLAHLNRGWNTIEQNYACTKVFNNLIKIAQSSLAKTSLLEDSEKQEANRICKVLAQKITNFNNNYKCRKGTYYKSSCNDGTNGLWNFIKMFTFYSFLLLGVAFSLLHYDTKLRTDPENSWVLKLEHKIDELGYRPHVERLEKNVEYYFAQGEKKYKILKRKFDKEWEPQIKKYSIQVKHYAYLAYVKSLPYQRQAIELAHKYLILLHKTTLFIYNTYLVPALNHVLTYDWSLENLSKQAHHLYQRVEKMLMVN